MPGAASHTMGNRERTALALLASAMFAEAHELDAESDLARCLLGYLTQLLRPRVRRRGHQAQDSYEIRDATDAPVFRRLATFMDALALSLGPWSGVGRALASWASRITLAVAEAERRKVALRGPSNELLTMAAALEIHVGDPVTESLAAAHSELRERAPADDPVDNDRFVRAGRIWSRGYDDGVRRSRRRR